MAQHGPAPAAQAAAQAAAAAQGVPGALPAIPPAYNQWRKTIAEYTRHMMPCSGASKAEVRSLIEVIDSLRQWTQLPENICLTALGSLTRDVLRDGIYQFLEARQGQVVGWDDVKTYIQNAYLEDNEPEYQKEELERSQQGAYEGIKEYGKGFLKAVGRAYTNLQLQDPIHLGRVIKSYIRGIYLGEVREKVYDSQPATLQQAMERSHTFSTSKKLRAERNGPRLEHDAFPIPVQARREEAMDVGYLTQTAPWPAIVGAKKVEAEKDRYDELEKKLTILQNKLGTLLKAQEKQAEGMKQFLQDTARQGRQNRQRAPPQNRQRALPQDRQWTPPQNRPDRRKWDDKGTPYCLKCGTLGHMVRECAGVEKAQPPPTQGN